MKDAELENKADTKLAIKKLLDFNLAQESYESMFHRKEELRLLVNRNQSLSELLDILRLAVRSNARELVKVLVEEKGAIPDTDTLHYALANTEMSTKFSKMDQEYSVEILKYLMRQTKYMKAELDSPQEKLDLQEKQESFIQALRESRYICINNIIWNKDKQSIEFKEDKCWWSLEERVIVSITKSPEFIVDTDRSTLTIYEVVKNRLIASAYLEKYSEIVKAENRNGDGNPLYKMRGGCSNIQLVILQLLDFCVDRKEYPYFLVDKILHGEKSNATAMQALLTCKDENGQVMLGDKIQNKKWCISLYQVIGCRNVERVADFLGVSYAAVKLIPKAHYEEYINDTRLCLLQFPMKGPN